MTAQMTIGNVQRSSRLSKWKQNSLRFMPARLEDGDAVIALFGALHTYNASLDAHFALSDDWETILRAQFRATYADQDMQ